MAYRDIVLADTPLGYWRLGEPSGTSANDDSPNNLDGVYSGGVTLGQAGALVDDADKAAQFDGSDARVVLPVGVGDLASAIAAKSFEAWVQITDPDGPILSVRHASSGNAVLDFGVGFDGVDNAGTGRLFVICRADNNSGLRHLHSPDPIHDGLAHHVVWTRDPDQTHRLYIDGLEVAAGVDTMAAGITGNLVRLMEEARWVQDGLGPPTQRYLAGILDEVAVYPVALSAPRVLAHYHAGSVPRAAPHRRNRAHPEPSASRPDAARSTTSAGVGPGSTSAGVTSGQRMEI